MKRFLLGYLFIAGAIAVYAWQTSPTHPTPVYTPAPGLDDYAWLLSVTILYGMADLLYLLFLLFMEARFLTELRLVYY